MKGMIVIGTALALIVGALNYFAPEGKAAMNVAGNSYHAKYEVVK